MSFKESWQNFLTKIDNRIPIKKITGPLDKKNPLTSFFLFLVIVLVVLYLIFGSSLIGAKSNYTDVTIRLADDQKNILDNFTFKIRNHSNFSTNEYTTNENGSLKVSLDKEQRYSLIAENENYKYFEEEIFFQERNTFNFMLIAIDISETFTKTVYFVDALTNQRIEDELSVQIVCDNDEVVTSGSQTNDGTLSLNVPSSCDSLIANISGERYSINSASLSLNESVLKINRLDNTETNDSGSVKVTVFSDDDLIIDNSITLKLFSVDDPVNSIRSIQTNFSEGFFNSVPVGEYIVKASDVSNRYLPSQETVLVTRNNISETSISLVDTGVSGPIIDPDTNQTIEIMEINVFIKDKDTGEIIDQSFSPKVTLLLDTNQNVDEKYLHEGFIFNIDKNKSYSLKATAEGYIPGEIITVNNSQTNYTFNLEKITISNVSDIIVSVRDEDDKPIVGIKSWIYDKEGQYIDPRFEFSQTDVNGIVIFENIPELDFTVRVRNSYIDEISSLHNNLPPEDTNLSIPVTIGKGTINLSLKNKLDDVVSDATVTFYSETGEVLGTSITSSQGTLQNQIKADKRVFIHIESEGYLPYFTELFRIYKNKTINKDVILERPLETSQVVTEYLGLYDADNKKVESLKNNQVFYLKYKVLMPSGSNSFNFAFRAGNQVDVVEDIVYILSQNDSLAIPIYYDKEPFGISGNYLESKLVNFKFIEYPASVHELTVPIRVKDAKINDSAFFFYKASQGAIDYMDTDSFSQLQYFVEATSLCNDTFCFSGQYVDVLEDLRYDIGNNRLVGMKVNSEYLLEYVITNASQRNFPTARLSSRNIDSQNNPTNMVSIKEYDVYGEFSSIGSSSVDDLFFNVPFNQNEILSENIKPFSKIDFNLSLFPLIVGQSKLENRIASLQEIVYTLPINFAVTELDTMVIDYEPKNIVPGVDFILTVTVKDSSGNYVSGANINILQKINNSQVSVSTGKTTNQEGKVDISMPALRNNETFVIEAIKSKYYAEPLEFSINSDILDVFYQEDILKEENPLQVSIHKMDMDGSEYLLTLKNKTDYPLTLKPFNQENVSFNRPDLLNLGQTINFINNQISQGLVIPENESKDLTFKFAPSESARTIPVTQEISGVITGVVLLNNKEQIFSIPIDTKISVGLGVAEDNCLVVLQGDGQWDTVVSQSSQTISLDVKNTCMSKEGNQPVSIKNLQAKLSSQGDRYGVYLLNVVGPNGGQVQLTENSYRTVVNEMVPGQEYRIDITFNTNGVKFADVKSNIYLNAQIETENGLEYVNKSPKDILLKTNISVMDLTECFTYVDSSGKTINSGGLYNLEGIEANNLTIQNNCVGKAVFKMDLCQGNDYGCRDLTITNTDQENNILNFSLNEAQKTIEIKRESTKAPGAYILNNKVSVVNNYGRDLASSFVLLKINAKDPDGLWMEDPFIEISEDKESEVVRLYNNDIETTPWDYVENTPTSQDDNDYKQQTNISSVFSNYLSDEFNRNEDVYNKMRFSFIEDLEYLTQIQESPWMPVSGAIAITTTAAALAYGGIIGSISLLGSTPPALLAALAAIPGWGWAAIGVVVLGSWAATSWKNEFEYPILELKYLDVEPKYTKPGNEILKTITVGSSSENISYLNVFDITGARYFTYYDVLGKTADADKEVDRKIKDRLTKDTVLSLSDYQLCKAPNFSLNDSYASIIKNRNCASTFNNLSIDEGILSHSVDCYGTKPTRHKIQLITSFKYSCVSNEVLWPEQSGIKPLKFIFTNEFYNQLYESPKKYNFNSYQFHPTLEDSVEIQDPSFKGSDKIGDYRFAYSIVKPKETPNYDLGLEECVTDTGKIGFTGEGAVPNIYLDWKWDLSDTDKCSQGYCDATQLSQVVLNRINDAEKLISSNYVQCPISTEQIMNNSFNNNYRINDAQPYSYDSTVAVGKIGLDSLYFNVEDNKLVVSSYIDNRTGFQKTVSINSTLDNKSPMKAYYRDLEGDLVEVTNSLNNFSVDVLSSDEEWMEVYLEFYNNDGSSIVGEDLSFSYQLSSDDIDNLNNSFSSTLELEILDDVSSPECQTPAITFNDKGISYIDMWFNKEMYPDNVVGSGWSQEDVRKLKDILEFDAYLITDRYNQSFINDFDMAYGGLASKQDGSGTGSQALMASPTVFSDGYLSKLFKNNLTFVKQYSNENNNVNINVPGKYRVKIDFAFENSSWNFERNQDVDVNAFVTFRLISSPETDSVFYRLPLNGFVGQKTSGYDRQGYGVSYFGDDIRISGTDVITGADLGSNAYRRITINQINDLDYINNSFETRGNVLSLTYKDRDVDLKISPSKAIPILMEIKKNNNDPLNVFYRLKDKSDNTFTSSSSLFRWTGVGSGCDFSGTSLHNIVYYDRYSGGNGPQGTYLLDWPQVTRQGDVYLRSIFYAPERENYTLDNRSDQGVNVKFSLNGNSFSNNVSLDGTGNADITSIKSVFDLVRENKICVVNSSDGSSSEFFYNPAEIYSEKFLNPPSNALECS